MNLKINRKKSDKWTLKWNERLKETDSYDKYLNEKNKMKITKNRN